MAAATSGSTSAKFWYMDRVGVAVDADDTVPVGDG